MASFVEPVTTAQVPRLAERVFRTSQGAVIGSFLVGTAVHWSDALRGRSEVATALGLWLAMAFVSLSLLAAIRSPWGRSRAEWFAALAVLLTFGEVLVTGEYLGGGQYPNPGLPYIASIPLIFSAIVAWRPSFPLALGLIGAVISAIFARQVDGLPWDIVELRALLCVALGVLGAFVDQSRRRLWLSLERSDSRARLVAADRLAHLGRLSGALAHEVKTPLATVLNQLSMVRSLSDELLESIGHEQVTPDDLREIAGESAAALAAAQDAAQRAARLIQSMREQTRTAGPGSRSRFAVARRVEASVLLLKDRLRTAGIEVEIEPTNVELLGPPLQFDQVLTNLLRNAVDAMEEAGAGSRITVSAELRSGGTALVVQDDGPGVPGELREQIFEQGFSTKGGDRGLGLGLWLCRNLLQSSFGATLTLVDTPPPGARFECWFQDQAAPGVPEGRSAVNGAAGTSA